MVNIDEWKSEALTGIIEVKKNGFKISEQSTKKNIAIPKKTNHENINPESEYLKKEKFIIVKNKITKKFNLPDDIYYDLLYNERIMFCLFCNTVSLFNLTPKNHIKKRCIICNNEKLTE